MFELEIEKIRNRKRKAKPKTQLNPRPRPGPLSLFPVTAQHSPLQPSSFPRGPASFFPQPARACHLPSPLPGLPRLAQLTRAQSPARAGLLAQQPTRPHRASPSSLTARPRAPASPPARPARAPRPATDRPDPLDRVISFPGPSSPVLRSPRFLAACGPAPPCACPRPTGRPSGALLLLEAPP